MAASRIACSTSELRKFDFSGGSSVSLLVSPFRRPQLKRVLALFVLLLPFQLSFAQDLASFEKRVIVRTLPNGLTVVLMRREEAPVFSFQIMVDAGSAQDPKGLSGLAHMFEHMAFKGTPTIGTKDWAKEKPLLEELEKAYRAYDVERRKIVGTDPKKIAELEQLWRSIQKEADALVIPNQFGQIIESHGGTGLNATTAEDQTQYFYSLPANEVELWAYLESERFLHPVFREFYKERDVVLEERRMRTDSRPIGRLIEQLDATAFVAHPYKTSGIGWASEIASVSATEAADFYEHYYKPANIVLSVVGDIDVEKTYQLIERYFGRLPDGAKPPDLRTVEPPQAGERTVTIREKGGQPWYVEAYHRPAYDNPDDAVYDAIADIMSNGRVSRLDRALVRDQQVALFAGGENGFPGSKYPHLFLFYAVPNRGKTNELLATAFQKEIERMKTQDVTDDELKMFKTRARAGLLRSLDNNAGLAANLATYQMRYGDWRELFRQLDRIDKVSKADIRRVANATFVTSNRTVGTIETLPASAPQQEVKQ
jgi:predicted Zn-dependent peptidase